VYNHSTHQRSVSLLDIPEDIKPKDWRIKGQELEIKCTVVPFLRIILLLTFSGIDGHESKFDLDWLIKHSPSVPDPYQPIIKPQLWTADTFPWAEACINAAEFQRDQHAARKRTFEALLCHGFAVVAGAEDSLEGTREVVKDWLRMDAAQSVYDDGFWQLTTRADAGEKAEVSDSSYTTAALECHTDATYYTEAFA